MGSIGDLGFELLHAQNAFYQLVGPYINGYAFGDTDALVKIVEKVQQEGRRVPDLQAAYPGVTFRSKSEWPPANADLSDGMNQLISMLKEKKDEIRHQRIERGMEEKFSKLTSKELPSRYGQRHRRGENTGSYEPWNNMIRAILIALVALGLPTLYFAWLRRGILCKRRSSILSLPCQGVGAAAGHQSCRDARNQRVALHRPFHLVRALPLLRLYQKAPKA